MLRRFLFMLLQFNWIFSVAFATNKCVPYEPKLAQLTGIISMITYPGPPNYENVKAGDASETGGYLRLKAPIDVCANSHMKDPWNTTEKQVTMVQLVIHNQHDWRKIKNGNHVRISGTLFHQMTGHHHTRVLCEVQKIESI